MKPYYEQDGITIYHGDCREILPRLLVSADAVVTDPPYGVNWGTPEGPTRKPQRRVVGDAEPFDPMPWVRRYPMVVLWGANHFASRLPDSPSWLVWDKRTPGFTNDQADVEMAWSNLGGPARIFRKPWGGGGCFRGENGHPASLHPTQKPRSLMVWCISLYPPGTVLDPFMGSGTTLVAAKQLGRKAIGIEIEERYCEIAAQRLAQGVLSLTT